MTSEEAKEVLADRRPLLLRAAERIFRSRGILLSEEVEDTAQQACMKALQAIERGNFPREREHLFAWFTTIAHNAAHDALRRRGRRRDRGQQPLDDGMAEDSTGPLDELIEQEAVAADHRNRGLLPVYIEQLAEEEQKAVRLRLQGVPNRQIAGELGIPEGSVSALFRRVYVKLRRWLEGSGRSRSASQAGASDPGRITR